MICNTGDVETELQAQKFISVPPSIDCLQGILTIIPMQLLSLHIAELRKLDVSMAHQTTAPPPVHPPHFLTVALPLLPLRTSYTSLTCCLKHLPDLLSLMPTLCTIDAG